MKTSRSPAWTLLSVAMQEILLSRYGRRSRFPAATIQRREAAFLSSEAGSADRAVLAGLADRGATVTVGVVRRPKKQDAIRACWTALRADRPTFRRDAIAWLVQEQMELDHHVKVSSRWVKEVAKLHDLP